MRTLTGRRFLVEMHFQSFEAVVSTCRDVFQSQVSLDQERNCFCLRRIKAHEIVLPSSQRKLKCWAHTNWVLLRN